MTEEEYFRKNNPDYCYGDRPLSPYWDLFQDGVEFGERQSEKKVTDLKETNAILSESASINRKDLEYKVSVIEQRNKRIAELKRENAELKRRLDNLFNSDCWASEKLAKAKELILELYNAGRDVLMCRAEEKAYDNLSNAINDKSIEQFLKEIEK